jgi:hypothetical protein
MLHIAPVVVVVVVVLVIVVLVVLVVLPLRLRLRLRLAGVVVVAGLLVLTRRGCVWGTPQNSVASWALLVLCR